MYNPDQPYDSRRSPVAAQNIVATSQPLAVQSGLFALRKGGNAIDAALAAAITLTVVEPNNNGIGSDAFCILWDGEELVGLNASGRSPAGWDIGRFANMQKMPELGWESVTVPGAVSGWVALSSRFGKLPFEELFADAIHYAENGFLVGPKTAFYWRLLENRYGDFDDFRQHFFPPPKAGDIVHRPDLADTLREIAATRGESLYRGKLASKIVDCSTRAGGCLSLADLDDHSSDWVKPIGKDYKGVTLHEMPPNGQGLAAQIALGILNHLPDHELDSDMEIHQQIEAMKIASSCAAAHISDPHSMQVGVDELLDEAFLEREAKQIGSKATSLPPVILPSSPDTVYLAAADENGMMVSFIQSNFHAFGSGIVIPGTGIAMQNRGSGFVLDKEHSNCVGPRKRPFHTIIPGFVSEEGLPRMAFGVMGGHMQHQGHVQMVKRVFEFGQNPQAAIDAPRWHVYPDLTVGLEEGFDKSVASKLVEYGHSVRFEKNESVFGGAQLVQRAESGYVAGSDSRKEGLAAGY